MAMTYYFPWVRKGLGMFIQEKDAYTSEKGTPAPFSHTRISPALLLNATPTRPISTAAPL